mmetsp:Transcript_81285/g.99623  ORF Transcript_81285/g.99623 Transcript_81285/m.99623 type:complete len:448 (+) Transcript_81285:63-1406(+)
MSSLAFFLLINALYYIGVKTSRCAVGATYSDPDVDRIFTVDVDNGGGIVSEIAGFTERFTSIALDRKTSTVYAIEFEGSGQVFKIDLKTHEQILIGNIPARRYNGLYYNCHDDMLYTVDWRGPLFGGNYNIYQVNPITLQVKVHGQIKGTNRQALMISKDGTKFYLVDTWIQQIYEAPFNNPTIYNTVLLSPKIPPNVNIFSIDWLNTDANDNTAIICQNTAFTGSESECFSWDIYTGARTTLFQTERIWGLEMIYNFDCNNLPSIGTVMENQCGYTGVPNDPSDECPCFDNIDNSLDYCLSGCCDLGTLIKAKNTNPSLQYGVGFDDKSCFIKENGVITSQQIGLTDTQYYACETELITASQGFNCTVSEISGKSIFDMVLQIATEESLLLIMLYVIFIALWFCAIIVLIRICYNKMLNCCVPKNGKEYKAIDNVGSTGTDTSECV